MEELSDKQKKKELKRKRKEEEKTEQEEMRQQLKDVQEKLNLALEQIAKQRKDPSSPKRRCKAATAPEGSQEENSKSDSTSDTSESANEDDSRENEAARFLGDNPEQKKGNKLEIDEVIIPRVKGWIKSGLDKETKDEILKNIPLVGDNLNLEPPELNSEVAIGLNEAARKRDEHFRESHKATGTALAAVTTAVTLLFQDQEKPADRDEVMQLLADATKMLCELIHSNIVTRKAFITPAYDKKFKEILDNADSGKLLFGDKLGERFKDWQAIGKTEAEMKALKKTPFKPSNTNSVNWRRPSGQGANAAGRKKSYYNHNASRKDRSSYRSTRTYTQTQPMSHNRSKYHHNNQDHRRY